VVTASAELLEKGTYDFLDQAAIGRAAASAAFRP
jgi:hypothetical protein